MKRKNLILLSSLLVVGLGVLYFTLPKASTRQVPSFAERLSAGLGSVVTVPATQGSAQQAVEGLSDWIGGRSGVLVTGSSYNTLLTYSQQVAAGTRQKVSASQIQSALKTTFFEVVDDLSNQDLLVLRERLRVSPDLNASNTPPGYEPAVDLRSNGRTLSFEKWDAYAAEYRDGQTAQAIAWRILTAPYIENAVSERLDLYAASGLAEWSQSTYTPLQALAIYYSVVSEDYGNGDKSGLESYMERVATQWYPSHGIYGISVAGRKAYGANGFLYRSATDYFMSDSALSFFLTRLYQ